MRMLAAAPAENQLLTEEEIKKEVETEDEEETMPPKRVEREASEKKEETGDDVVAEAASGEDETASEDAAAKIKGGRKATKGRKGKKEVEQKREDEEMMQAKEDDAKKAAAKSKGGRKAATGRKGKKEEDTNEGEQKAEDEEMMEAKEEKAEEAVPKSRGSRKAAAKPTEKEAADDDEEEAPKRSRRVAAKPNEEEPEPKKLKKAAAKGNGKKADVESVEMEEEKGDEKEKEEEKEETPKARGRGRGPKKVDAEPEKEEEEKDEEEKPAGRPKRGAAVKAAATTKKIAEEEQAKPKRSGKAAPKKADDDDEEDAKPAPTKARRGKQPAKGRGSKKAEESDEDGSIPSKKTKLDDDGEDEDVKSGAKSMTKSIRRTVEVKGKAAVDPLCTRKASTSHVYTDGDLIYDVMLNQTNIGNNNNKFYVIQLLEEDDSPKYSVWFRWGRVGYDGQSKLVECGTNLQSAIKEFASKFEAKSKNQWPTTFEDFETYPGKYTMIEMDYGNGGGEGGEGGVKIELEQEEEEKKCKVVSKLDERVQQLIHLMCSIRTMAQAVKSLEFDADKSPLGKLTQQQIKEGYACLGKIEKFIEKKSFGADFKQAVNEYYTKVPHACGFRPPAMIKTPQLLKQEIELLDLLSGIEYAIKTMKQETREEDVHPVDRHYASLKCGLAPMEKEEEEYKLVSEYLSKTHGSTHTINMGLKNVFRVERDGEDGNEDVMEKIGNRKLLWHGSRLSNFFGILSQGLRIAPPEAPCTGYMFGKGVYFADMASKSGNYCYASEDGQTGFLLLAEVALGEENQLTQALYTADQLPEGKHSTWGLGRTMPDPNQNKHLNDKVVVPCGKPITRLSSQEAQLLYNEFIVYDTKQIRMRYLVEVEFNFV